MHNFLEMNDEEQDKLIKMVTDTTYKKFRSNPPRDFTKGEIAQAFPNKVNMNQVSTSDFRKYIREHIMAPEDTIFTLFFKGMHNSVVKEKFDSIEKFVEIIGKETTYDQLTDEQWDNIRTFEEEYKKSKIPLEFDRFVRFCCSP